MQKIEFDKPTAVLASGSMQRAGKLKDAGIPFVQILSPVDDTDINYDFPHTNITKRQEKQYAKTMALAKLKPFIGNVKNGAVITADTTVLCNGRILEKPQSKQEARENQEFISGNNCYVYTAITIYYNGRTICKVLTFKVKIAPLPPHIIDKIVEEPEIFNNAGYWRGGALGPYATSKGKFATGDDAFVYTIAKMLKKLKVIEK